MRIIVLIWMILFTGICIINSIVIIYIREDNENLFYAFALPFFHGFIITLGITACCAVLPFFKRSWLSQKKLDHIQKTYPEISEQIGINSENQYRYNLLDCLHGLYCFLWFISMLIVAILIRPNIHASILILSILLIPVMSSLTVAGYGLWLKVFRGEQAAREFKEGLNRSRSEEDKESKQQRGITIFNQIKERRHQRQIYKQFIETKIEEGKDKQLIQWYSRSKIFAVFGIWIFMLIIFIWGFNLFLLFAIVIPSQK